MQQSPHDADPPEPNLTHPVGTDSVTSESTHLSNVEPTPSETIMNPVAVTPKQPLDNSENWFSRIFELDFTIPPLLTVIALVTLGFSVFRWYLSWIEKKRLASIICASRLEILAKDCLELTQDYGSWYDPETQPTHLNETVYSDLELPDFTLIANIGALGTDVLNRVLSLETLLGRMRSEVYALWRDDEPEFDEGFEARRLAYAGYGIFLSRLAAEIRATISAPDLGGSASAIHSLLKDRLPILIAECTYLNDPKAFYERAVLPTPQSYWPFPSQINNARLEIEERQQRREKAAAAARAVGASPVENENTTD